MKKNPLRLALCWTALAALFSNTAQSQYDYFQWTKTQVANLSALPKIPNSGLAVDQYDRYFYLAPVNNGARVYWTYGDLLTTAAAASPYSNLVHYPDGTGDHLFYITANNRIGCTEYLYTTNAWSSNTGYVSDAIAVGSSIAVANLSNVYYIRASDGAISNYYSGSGGSGYAPLNTQLPTAAASSNIILNDGRVFYITSNYKIACVAWDNATWNWQSVNLPNAPGANSIYPGSKLQVTGNSGSYNIYFVAPDQKMYQYYNNGTVNGATVLVDAAPKVKAGTDILAYSPEEIRYVGVDGNLQTLYMDGCSWSYYTLNTTCGISDPAIAANATNKTFFYSYPSVNKLANTSETSGFVYKKRNKLMLNGSPFYPIGMNYVAQINSDDNGATFYPSPTGHYANNVGSPPFNTKATCLSYFDQHLADIASMGFNSIRFTSNHLVTNPNDNTDPNLYIYYWPHMYGNVLKVVDQQTINQLFLYYDYVLGRAANYGLKVKFFIGLENGQKNTNAMATYNSYLTQFANHYKNNNTIYSYALLQEADNNTRIDASAPSAYRGKGDICYYTDAMYNSLRAVDQNHLINLSVMGTLATFGFDPAILHVDFMSFHPYPDPADNTYQQAKEEIQWMSNTMKKIGKPWIIGETSYPGNNESPIIAHTGSYADQKNYAQFILTEAFSAGACGVCWWQYRDVAWSGGDLDPALSLIYPKNTGFDNMNNYMGVIDHNGNRKPLVGGAGLPTTSNVFQSFVPSVGCSMLYPAANYYRTVLNPSFTFSGTVKDPNGNPIPDAIILGFNSTYTTHGRTYSKADGSFSLQYTTALTDIRVTAPGYVTKYWVNNGTVVLNPVSCGLGNAKMAFDSDINTAEETGYVVFPNPNEGQFTLKKLGEETGNVDIEIRDLLGRSILQWHVDQMTEQRIDLSTFKSGLYFIHISGDGLEEVKKVIKQ